MPSLLIRVVYSLPQSNKTSLLRHKDVGPRLLLGQCRGKEGRTISSGTAPPAVQLVGEKRGWEARRLDSILSWMFTPTGGAERQAGEPSGRLTTTIRFYPVEWKRPHRYSHFSGACSQHQLSKHPYTLPCQHRSEDQIIYVILAIATPWGYPQRYLPSFRDPLAILHLRFGFFPVPC